MAIQITRTGKYSLIVDSPVMNAAGTMGFANAYHTLVKMGKLGAFVTNPVTLGRRSPARGPRVVPLDAGVLLHTGLPNPGLSGVIKEFQAVWYESPVPIIMHIVGTTSDEIRRMVRRLDEIESVAALELGLRDDITWEEAAALVEAATEAEKPILVRIPVYDAYEVAHVAADAGADALVVAAPPRGTARDRHTGRLVGGRVYGPLVKPMILRLVEVLAQRLDDIPIIGAGGIHSPQDARDYLEVGAVAVQVDSVIWSQPALLEHIADTLDGPLMTHMGSTANDWSSDVDDTDFAALFKDNPEEN